MSRRSSLSTRPRRTGDHRSAQIEALRAQVLEEAISLDQSSGRLEQIPIENLRRGRYQSRNPVSRESVKDLAESIARQGIIQPIVVRPLDEDGQYEILAGERRWIGAQVAGLTRVPAIVREVNDQVAAAVMLIENLQREDLNPIEEARGLNQLSGEFGMDLNAIGQMVGKSISTISRTLGLLTLLPTVQEMIEQGALGAGHGKVLLGLDATHQLSLAQKAAARNWSVRELEAQKAALERPARRRTTRDPDLVRLEQQVQERVGSPVRLQFNPSSRQGRIEIKVSSLEEFNGVLEKLGLMPRDL